MASQQRERCFSVMSYNVLADRLASGSKFSHTTSEILGFDFRGPRIVAEIEKSDACIVCLQEVDRVKDFYEPQLECLGMQLIHYKRPKFFKGDGIAIAYRSEQVRLLETEYVDLNDLASFYSNSTYKRDNQAMFCLFEHLGSKQKVIAGNLHLHFNP
mmetsp:Transcript_934/g.1446  ORF Transcript_934/g.1446 Transcript_934/m.1446 type:complete len:157 (-) Transcript_934:732-1202(-)